MLDRSIRHASDANSTYASLLTIGGAALLCVALAYVPLLAFVVYPFKMFGTLVHEWAHALATLATGGHVVELVVNGDLSGDTTTTGGFRPLVLSAGYVGVVALGGLLLLVPARSARTLLLVLGVTTALSLVIGTLLLGTTFSPTTWAWTLVFAALVLSVGRFASGRWQRLFARFIALELCLAGVDGLRALVWLTWNAPSSMTDATIGAREMSLPAPVWTILWVLTDLVILTLVLRSLVGQGAQRRRLAPPHVLEPNAGHPARPH